jgi:hypothetical protein
MVDREPRSMGEKSCACVPDSKCLPPAQDHHEELTIRCKGQGGHPKCNWWKTKYDQGVGGGEKTLDKVCSQALIPEAVKVEAKLPAKLQVVRAEAPLGPWSPETKVQQDWVTHMLAVWGISNSRRACQQECPQKDCLVGGEPGPENELGMTPLPRYYPQHVSKEEQ